MARVEAVSKGGPQEEEIFVVRFNLRQRAEHWAVMGSFIVLVVTGLPQKYFESGWAEWIIITLGGIDMTRLLHRYFGILLTLLTLNHIGYVMYAVFFKKLRPSMIPTIKDASDAIMMLKYCLGVSDDQPRFDRYDYRQKFEYWGLLFGVFIMIITGFILYYPNWATVLFPGQVVAAAKLAHSWEAMLALSVVVTWHLYGAHFNPEVFPFDTTIFTGKISLERMLKEHPLEYARMKQEEAMTSQEKGEEDSPLGPAGG